MLYTYHPHSSLPIPSPPILTRLSSPPPHENDFTNPASYLFFQSLLTILSLYVIHHLSVIWYDCSHSLILLTSSDFPSATSDTPCQTCIGPASYTKLMNIALFLGHNPQDSPLNLTFLPKRSHTFLWLHISSTH